MIVPLACHELVHGILHHMIKPEPHLSSLLHGFGNNHKMPPDLQIKSPRRILWLSTSDEVANDTLKSYHSISGSPRTLTNQATDLTGSIPTPNNATLSGTSHYLSLKTAYYEADVPIWIDTIDPASPSSWSADFLLEEAAEVLQALGGYVLSFPRPVTNEEKTRLKEVVKEVGKVVKRAERKGWDGVLVLVLMSQDIVPHLELDQAAMEEWEDWGIEHGGWEVIDGNAKAGTKNEFGEKAGWERAKEALEANSWEGVEVGVDLEDIGLDLADFVKGEVDEEMRGEMEGMKQAIYDGGHNDAEEEGDDQDVEEMELLVRKMQSLRGKSEGVVAGGD